MSEATQEPINNRKGAKKHKFTPEEDQLLLDLVKKYGLFDWESIAEEMEDRTARQCRDRWNYYLNPDVRNNNWTEEEEKLLLKKYARYGPKWSLISKFFDNRTDVNIKNHYIVMQRKTARNDQPPKIKTIPPEVRRIALQSTMEPNHEYFDFHWHENQFSVEF
ncbi:Myb-like DNA-binding domain containing protein [Trichomonas vaginalis G3]|uniref:Myb-like DNA-binding domain containing protein n=1 Tax=Trichomonas vaginalis (strain ATCC PRA-98 / G3) TaxID=412133 RepID=A2FHT0_TRIV3|nr:RNA polymerase II transcription regulator recruiting protein [Trichomonas vaginalis G3]EAX95540.1 Myb-like DNA-binding domain containing protein [Trichomonas vaginalis G3]KAI5514395.1 RNA polymerase II transcription regulator recruiting protein [Trichomonas vaginalis G3]|eukprot:XP_001308470.1 Myb-like DNA-binding domain containing protein [Trichomonas vaginalis G3]